MHIDTPPLFEALRVSLADETAEIVFTRPELLNRFDALAHDDFVAALRWVAHRPAVRALVIGAEGRAFSAGGDFDDILAAHSQAEVRARMTRHARDVFQGLVDLHCPVIAAVQGAAIGLGATIACLADIVVAWKEAKFADTHVAVGIVAGDGGVIAWSQSIGINRAKRYLLTGDIITGAQAYDMGLVSDLVDKSEDALPAARAIAQRLRSLAPEGVNGTKRAFAALTRARAMEAFEYGLALEMASMTSPRLPEIVEKMKRR